MNTEPNFAAVLPTDDNFPILALINEGLKLMDFCIAQSLQLKLPDRPATVA